MRLHMRSITSLDRARFVSCSQRNISVLTGRTRPRITSNGLASSYLRPPLRHCFLTSRQDSKVRLSKVMAVMAISGLFALWLYPADAFQLTDAKAKIAPGNAQSAARDDDETDCKDDESAWTRFAQNFDGISIVPSTDGLSDMVVDYIVPEWAKHIPGYIRKLQRELSMAPESLAAEIWQEAHDPYTHPEIEYSAKVRVSNDLCDDEKTFLERRKRAIIPALARYLGLTEGEIHPDDVPTIAMCGSGGGLRALVAGTGSFLATTEDGLFDCTTYLSGVSGSCWLQTLYYSSVTGGNFRCGIDHLKARLGTHIAYPPVAFTSLMSSPTNKYLLSGLVEKLKGDPNAEFGLVDIYGILLAARLLVPRGELGVNEKDFKLSNQREFIRYGQNPLPIYTAVRHEIPEVDSPDFGGPGSISEEAKDRAKREAWFQWFEITPYEFFCEEFSAGIPTWALGRKFKNGLDVPAESGLRLPELRIPLLLGIWGSAFCATLSHYYREVRPIIQSITGLHALDELIWGRNKDLSMVHPIEPATIPNFVHGMYGKLPEAVPQGVYDNQYIQLMDAGMSNNLPIYPLLRPGRDVDIIVTFDASADIKTDNWLSVVEGYARQRGVKGWPVGIGWPKPSKPPSTAAAELDEAQALSAAEAEAKIAKAKNEQATRHPTTPSMTKQQPEPKRIDGRAGAETDVRSQEESQREAQKQTKATTELGYCTVWVGTTQERSSDHPPPPPVDDTSSWRLMEPDAGITVVYLPFLANEKAAPGVDVAVTDYLSTWNFVYTPRQIDEVVGLARANYAEGRERIRATVRAVYERRKRRRLEAERERDERWKRFWNRRLGKGGDQFS
ncbi:Cytosolic phospholipase A2 zeta [Madurella mycetomatis]|uniref:Lysophospholipase n=1 Tax=Madurella mycetomatis TaxID=100816 RepID=A0A175W6V2_9PEZI|nr:Cytosolic phospholipase A2 zeta [Madurella mycetomatis]